MIVYSMMFSVSSMEWYAQNIFYGAMVQGSCAKALIIPYLNDFLFDQRVPSIYGPPRKNSYPLLSLIICIPAFPSVVRPSSI